MIIPKPCQTARSQSYILWWLTPRPFHGYFLFSIELWENYNMFRCVELSLIYIHSIVVCYGWMFFFRALSWICNSIQFSHKGWVSEVLHMNLSFARPTYHNTFVLVNSSVLTTVPLGEIIIHYWVWLPSLHAPVHLLEIPKITVCFS